MCAWRGTEVSPLGSEVGSTPNSETMGWLCAACRHNRDGDTQWDLGDRKNQHPRNSSGRGTPPLCAGSGIFTVSLDDGHCGQWDVDL